jgi:hypothetical protein
MNTVKLTDNHLRVINTALETYFRLKTGQVDIALDYAYGFKLNHDQADAIAAIIKSIALPEISTRGSSYSFNSPEIGDGKIAYEIKKTFEEVLAVKNNDGYYGYTVDFHGPLKASDEPLPEVVGFKNYIDYHLDKKQSKKVNKFFATKDFDGMWNYIDFLKLNLPSGERTEVIPSFECVTIRVTKPRKPEKEIEQNS